MKGTAKVDQGSYGVLDRMIHVISTGLFAILTVMWNRNTVFNVLMKASFLIMTCWHGLYALRAYGYTLKDLP